MAKQKRKHILLAQKKTTRTITISGIKGNAP